ncbi:MAG TPA: DUF4139 domain-containing protein [Candidatus Limnocylindrales bacterium]|nr:DUF4139 domain-containing protein [Candidatus Limnocylindrales bacterium]
MRFFPTLLCAAVACAADLPVTQVTLYKHGIGFFERAGSLAAGESARLDFTEKEMNDVLKSLTLTERGGGKISGLRYDSMDPLSHALASFPFKIGDSRPLASMLDTLKGARIEMQVGTERVSGLVVGSRTVPATANQPEREQVTLLLDSGDIRIIDLSAASSIRFSDAQLQAQFREYLSLVAGARSKDKRSVYIDSTDAKQREIVATYTIPAAVWKSSYRLIMNASGQPTLEGWAIVDNTTDDDWRNVRLSLVSGRPISFISQLYEPKYVERPEADLADDLAAAPVIHAGAYKKEAAPPPPAPAAAPRLFGKLESGANMTVNAEAASVNASMSSIGRTADANELGELFEYRIAQPVTIRKNESAMLPFLQQSIQSRKLLIWSDHGSEHPTNAAELTNSTGKTLDGGPITVYDSGAYAGEALMETVKSGDKRLISYAVDLGTRVTSAFDRKNAIVREIHAIRGMLITKLAAEETCTYTAYNVDQKPKTLIIEHEIRADYSLLNQKPAEKTAKAYRFEIQLKPGATQEFPVAEERVFNETVLLTNMTPDVLLAYIQNRSLSDAGRRELQRISAQKTQIADTARELADAQTQSNNLMSDESRLRMNITNLNAVSGQQQQVQNYAHQLELIEQQLATLRDRQAELQKKQSALQGELNRMIEALSF